MPEVIRNGGIYISKLQSVVGANHLLWSHTVLVLLENRSRLLHCRQFGQNHPRPSAVGGINRNGRVFAVLLISHLGCIEGPFSIL
nr:putative integron gene cassette protein [uncultured bacterium]